MSEEPAAALADISVVYIGPCRIKGGAAGAVWIPEHVLDAFGEIDVEAARAAGSPFTSKGSPKSVIGGIYSAKGVIEDSHVMRLNFGTLKFEKRSTSPLIPAFEIMARAHEVQQRRESMEKKAKAAPAVMREIAALAKLHNSLASGDREAFDLAVLGLIRGESMRISRERMREREAKRPRQ